MNRWASLSKHIEGFFLSVVLMDQRTSFAGSSNRDYIAFDGGSEMAVSVKAAKPITVKAAWDDDALVWYVEASDLPGLHIEAMTIDELRDKLPGAIEDLLEKPYPFDLITP
jgi:predicted RNase H-like HicB family nuclease